MIIQFILTVGIFVRYKRGGEMPTENQIESLGQLQKPGILILRAGALTFEGHWG